MTQDRWKEGKMGSQRQVGQVGQVAKGLEGHDKVKHGVVEEADGDRVWFMI